MPESAPLFDADAQVGRLFHWIDENGRTTIAAGLVTLAKGTGEVIAEAPLADVWADVHRGSVFIWIGGQRYIVAVQLPRNAYDGHTASTPIKNFKKIKEFDAQFMQALVAEGGHIGKPPKP